MIPVIQISILLLSLLACVVLVKERKAGSVSLAITMFLLALIQMFDLLVLREPPDIATCKRVALFLKSLAPVSFLLYGSTFRKKSVVAAAYLPQALLSLIGLIFAVGALKIPLPLIYSAVGFAPGPTLVLGPVGYWYHVGLMILCVAALVNLEAVFASIRGTDRWRVKYEFFGVGSALGVLIVFFSLGLLYRSVTVSQLTVRSGVLVASALLVGYSRLFRGQSQKVAVSRYVFYRSFTLLAVGIYLLALGLAGQLMRSLRLTVSQDLMLIVAFLSGIAFLILIFSEEVRRRVKVFAAKHFYAHKHDYREQWLGFSQGLAACRSLGQVQGVVLEAYRETFGLRSASMYLASGGAAAFTLGSSKGREGVPDRFPVSPGLRGYFTETGRVLNPGDGEYSPTAEERDFFRRAEAWLLVPLIAGETLVAVVVLVGQVAPEKLIFEDYDLMKIIGRQAALSINNFRLSEALAEAREMAAVAKISSFVIHDLKNLAYTFSLMMSNADELIGEPEFQRDLLKSIHGTVAKMNAIIAKLKAFPEKLDLQRAPADLSRLVRESLAEVRSVKPTVVFGEELAVAEASVDEQEIKKVVLNLLLNACDAVAGQGTVLVRTGCGERGAFLSVADDGCGMAPACVQEHLVKPCRTTKEKGLGIGLYQCRQIVEAHGGRIEVESREGHGSVFTASFREAGEGQT